MQGIKAFWLGAVVLSYSANAAGFCRASACDPTQESCARDLESGCSTSGAPLYWESSCVDIYVQEDGAPGQELGWQDTANSVQLALDTWLGVDCGDGATPSLQVNLMGPVACDVAEYNSEGRNANIVLLREKDWPHTAGAASDTIGKTWPSFELGGDGRLWDADIELNAFDYVFTTDGSQGRDLDNVLLHEVGHWLGLDHSKARDSVMLYNYSGTGVPELSLDDELGICAVYPPGRVVSSTSCAPRHGFSELCLAEQPDEPEPPGGDEAGCSFASPKPIAGEGALAFRLWAISLVTFCTWARRSRRRQRSGSG